VPLARHLGVPAAEALVRCRPTPPQTALSRPSRRVNPRGAFAVPSRHRRRLAGRRVLLVDDVVTTGATLDAAARALLAAGAREVHAAAVARTPPPPAVRARLDVS
jgi:predicted amidophosphoribosyltransferase